MPPYSDSGHLSRIADGRTDLVFDWIVEDGDAGAKADGKSLIQWCAYYGDVSAIRHLLAHGETLDSLGADKGLMAAAFHSHWRLCQYLVEQGADANHVDPETGETPLHAATSANRAATDLVVQVLLDAGANPNCATLKDRETGSFMRDVRTKSETPLHRAAAFCGGDVIRMLIAAGAVIDSRDQNGDTPLSLASWHRRSRPVLRLLCFPPHRIQPDPEGIDGLEAERIGMDRFLLGQPHPVQRD